MNNYCKRCRLSDGCLQKCKEAEIYEKGYNDAVDELKKLKKTTMENKYKLWVARDKNGFLFVYEDKPERCKNQREWWHEKNGADFSCIKPSLYLIVILAFGFQI